MNEIVDAMQAAILAGAWGLAAQIAQEHLDLLPERGRSCCWCGRDPRTPQDRYLGKLNCVWWSPSHGRQPRDWIAIVICQRPCAQQFTSTNQVRFARPTDAPVYPWLKYG